MGVHFGQPTTSPSSRQTDSADASISVTVWNDLSPMATIVGAERKRWPDGYVGDVAKKTEPACTSFTTTVSAFGNNAGIVVPPETLDALGAGKRPGVLVNVNGFEFQTTIGVMGGQCLIGVNAAIRKASGLAAGDEVLVALRLAEGPRAVEMSADFQSALDAHPDAKRFFEGLSNSLQRFHVDNINGAKAPETRQRRIDNAITLFEAGKSR